MSGVNNRSGYEINKNESCKQTQDPQRNKTKSKFQSMSYTLKKIFLALVGVSLILTDQTEGMKQPDIFIPRLKRANHYTTLT